MAEPRLLQDPIIKGSAAVGRRLVPGLRARYQPEGRPELVRTSALGQSEGLSRGHQGSILGSS